MKYSLPALFIIGCNLFAYASAIRLYGLHMILGDDVDQYGCKGSAGYYYCEQTKLCTHVSVNCLNVNDATPSLLDSDAIQ